MLAVAPLVSPLVVQQPPPNNQNTQNPQIVYPNPVGLGNLLVIFFDWPNTSGAISGTIDNLGNNWQVIDLQQVSGTLRTLYCLATIVTHPGACTVTVSTDAPRNYFWSHYEVNGATINLDGTPVHNNTTTNTGTVASTGVLTTSLPNSIVFAHIKAGSISTSPGSPWISEVNNNHGTAYQIGNPGSYSATWNFAASNWANTILAFAAGGNQPAAPPMILSDLPKSFHQLATPSIVLGQPLIKCISFRDSWKVTQPTQPASPTSNPNDSSYSWGFWDQAIAQAAQLGVLASFHVSTNGSANQPPWIKTIAQQFIDIAGDSMGVPWDSTFQAYVIAFIQAMGARYGSYANLFKWSTCIASTGSDWTMPHQTNGNWVNSGSFNCPAFGAQVNVPTTTNSGMSAGQYCFIPGFGWFYAKLNATNVNTQLVNAGFAGNASSGTIPANTTIQVSDLANWTSPAYNYTTAKLVNACNATVNAARAAFPNAWIQFQVGTTNGLDPYPGAQNYQYNAATQIAQAGYANAGNFGIDRDGFNPQIDTPAAAFLKQDSSGWYLLAQPLVGTSGTSGTTGSIPAGGAVFGQFDWPAFDPTGQYTSGSTNGYLSNGGVPYTDPVPVVNQTIAVAQLYHVALLEIYEQDIALLPVAPTPPPTIQYPAGRIIAPYGGQNQTSDIPVPASVAYHEPPYTQEEGPWMMLPYASLYPPGSQTEGTDVVPPPVYLTDLFSAQQTYPL